MTLESTKNIAVLYTEQGNKYCDSLLTSLVKFSIPKDKLHFFEIMASLITRNITSR